jgi:hypothetical protein
MDDIAENNSKKTATTETHGPEWFCTDWFVGTNRITANQRRPMDCVYRPE